MSPTRHIPQVAGALLVATLLGCAPWVSEPPSPYYKKLSELVHFPDFYPGLGTLYVQPTTLPYGPFQGYDRQGNLVDTIYMVPLSDMEKHSRIAELQGTPVPVDHVEVYFNGGHAGVDMPHYHIVLWHVSRDKQAALQ
jgi:hypothetical protein